MFGMSMTEIVIIVIFALLVLGPGELPAAARTIGKTLREVRKAGDDIRDTFEREVMQEKPLKIRPVAEAVSKDPPPPESQAGALAEPALPSAEPALPSAEPALPSAEPALPSAEPAPVPDVGPKV
jgi:sec-independent protein translocase protein TatB